MRILVAEDDRGLREVLVQGLEDAGYHVDAVDRGDDAIEQFKFYEYDVAILDWRMPGTPGIEVAAWARENRRPTAILMLTARDTPIDRIQGLDSGADDYMVKPFDFGELLARIRAVMRRRNPSAGPLLQVQDLTMDETTREVRRDGRAIELSAREFDLLRLLMMHPNQVLARDRILDQVWGYNFFGDANNVEVYIRYLRQKLSDEPHKLIQTVRGVGYRIKA